MQQLLDESASCVWITHGVHDFAHAKWLSPAILPNGIELAVSASSSRREARRHS